MRAMITTVPSEQCVPDAIETLEVAGFPAVTSTWSHLNFRPSERGERLSFVVEHLDPCG